VVTEVATFRSDGAYSDGRHPDAVRYTVSAVEDVRRRDFTINGLLLDPDRLFPQGLKPGFIAAFAARLKSCPDTKQFQGNLSEQFQGNLSEQFQGNLSEQFHENLPEQFHENLRAAVIDHVGGLADLEAGIVRALASPSNALKRTTCACCAPCASRTLRLRAGRCDCCRHASISSENQRRQPRTSARRADQNAHGGLCAASLELLDETGLLAEVLPEVARMKGVEQPPQFHPEGDVWTHTLLLLGQLEAGCPLTLAWGGLLHDVGKPPTFTRADRIRFKRSRGRGRGHRGRNLPPLPASRTTKPARLSRSSRTTCALPMRST